MNVLGIDGALNGFSVAVAGGGSILADRFEPGNVALESGLPAVAAVLREARVAAQAVDRIAVGCGPGGFTGLRIAISYAKSLAQAWDRPLVAIDSFDLLEHGSRLDRVLTVILGRQGVISARLRDGDRITRASGWVADVLQELGSALRRAQGDAEPLPVLGAPEDVLGALAERAIAVSPVIPSVVPAACAAALAAPTLEPASNVHAVRADYGELPAARVPRLK
ncbi:MAG TPA: tRNA (adenosine(37)-N6)-threonylcarbamoyltransferase complex dimerization subunit type 1 TsaB [Candidatus Baltobacteraceae bacterium]|nr:tRNA (adenosine(37)-N6)-threonylcarbamoyltransferase complex dimerization subunit type 1 TsaB [Candidatus Baltobacteraceae bacterium]